MKSPAIESKLTFDLRMKEILRRLKELNENFSKVLLEKYKEWLVSNLFLIMFLSYFYLNQTNLDI